MSDVLEISFIYAKDAIKIKTFIGTIPHNVDCINYMDIYNKLSKNDYLQSEPSDAVVSSYLMRQIQTVIKKSTTTSLFYVLGNIDHETINSIKDYIQSLTTSKIYYRIYHTPEVVLNGASVLFNEIIELDIDA